VKVDVDVTELYRSYDIFVMQVPTVRSMMHVENLFEQTPLRRRRGEYYLPPNDQITPTAFPRWHPTALDDDIPVRRFLIDRVRDVDCDVFPADTLQADIPTVLSQLIDIRDKHVQEEIILDTSEAVVWLLLDNENDVLECAISALVAGAWTAYLRPGKRPAGDVYCDHRLLGIAR